MLVVTNENSSLEKYRIPYTCLLYDFLWVLVICMTTLRQEIKIFNDDLGLRGNVNFE